MYILSGQNTKSVKTLFIYLSINLMSLRSMKRKLLVGEFNSEIRMNSWNVVDDHHNNYQPTALSMS